MTIEYFDELFSVIYKIFYFSLDFRKKFIFDYLLLFTHRLKRVQQSSLPEDEKYSLPTLSHPDSTLSATRVDANSEPDREITGNLKQFSK